MLELVVFPNIFCKININR